MLRSPLSWQPADSRWCHFADRARRPPSWFRRQPFSLLTLFSAAINPGEVKEPKNISEKRARPFSVVKGIVDRVIYLFLVNESVLCRQKKPIKSLPLKILSACYAR
jgi:hypothetical protein